MQERLREGQFALYKVRGEHNPADLLRKHIPPPGVAQHLATVHIVAEAGRAASAPGLSAPVEPWLATLAGYASGTASSATS